MDEIYEGHEYEGNTTPEHRFSERSHIGRDFAFSFKELEGLTPLELATKYGTLKRMGDRIAFASYIMEQPIQIREEYETARASLSDLDVKDLKPRSHEVHGHEELD